MSLTRRGNNPRSSYFTSKSTLWYSFSITFMIYENEIFKTASWRRKVSLFKAFDKKLKSIISTTLRKDQWSPQVSPSSRLFLFSLYYQAAYRWCMTTVDLLWFDRFNCVWLKKSFDLHLAKQWHVFLVTNWWDTIYC